MSEPTTISPRTAAALTGVGIDTLIFDYLSLGGNPGSLPQISAALRDSDTTDPEVGDLLAVVINERLLDLGLAPLLTP